MVLWDLAKATGDRTPFASIAGWAILTPSGKELVQWNDAAGIVFWDAKTAEKKRVVIIPETARKGIKYVVGTALAISPDGASWRWELVWATDQLLFSITKPEWSRQSCRTKLP